MKTMNYQEWIKQADMDLRAGRGDQMAHSLNQLTFSTIPRLWRKQVASICRRAGLFADGLRLLTPLIHPDRNKWGAPATAEEQAEYGVLLLKYGSAREAMSLLNQIPAKSLPEVHMYRAFCHMAEWNYASAAADLHSYIYSNPSLYQALIAKVNLAACLVSIEAYDEAMDLLNRNIQLALSEGARRLAGNCYELRGQIHLLRGHWILAENDLNESAKIFIQDSSPDQLFIKKWKAVLVGLQSGSLAELTEVRVEASQRSHWESVRDIDRFCLKIKFEPQLFKHLVFGTPYAPFRERVLRELNQDKPNSAFQFGHAQGPKVVVATGELANGTTDRVERQALAVIASLSRDLYRPRRIGELFGDLCPDQHFDIFTSHNRILKIFSRTRQWLRQADVPLMLINENGAHRLSMSGPMCLELEFDRAGSPDVVLEKLKRRFGRNSFTTAEACGELSISRQKFQRWFSSQPAQKVAKVSKGPLTQYRLFAA